MKVRNLDSFMCEFFKEGEVVRVDAKLLQNMLIASNNEKTKLKQELRAETIKNDGLIHTIKILKNGQESFLDLKA